jgi:AcrR family transcriptional regulator
MTEVKQASGRPRDAEAASAIRAATLKLINEHGYGNVSIAAIAAEANVARQTLYNRWNTKADLVLDALFETAGEQAAAPVHDPDKTCREQLAIFLRRVFSHLTANGGPIRALIASAQEDLAFRDVFKARFVKPREVMVTDLLRDAQHRGELDPNRDPEMLSRFVHGAFWYALLTGDPVDDDLVKGIVDGIFYP